MLLVVDDGIDSLPYLAHWKACPEPEVRVHRAANAIANFGFKGALES
jgi:hypothetical protein